MPKLKTHKGASKRFNPTKGGIKVRRANRAHILTKRPTGAKRNLRVGNNFLAHSDERAAARLLNGS